MATSKPATNKLAVSLPGKGDLSAKDEPTAKDTPETRHRRRLAAVTAIAGLWASRADIPADGLDYERETRAEWH